MKMIIGNEWIDSDKRFDVINPYTREMVDTVPVVSPMLLEKALQQSYEYQCDLTGLERASILSGTAATLEIQRDTIARLITSESGLCIKHALYEIDRAINCLQFSVLQAAKIDDIDVTADFVSNPNTFDPRLAVITEPWDLAVGITPFNHPLNMVVHKVAPAIAAGTPIVVKPSEKTPLTALKLGQILIENGLPANMVNIVTGVPSNVVVDQMVTYSGLDLVSFTGSVEVGKYIARQMSNGGNELKKYMPELGGNATFVVMDDCDISHAASIALGAFANSGQRCTAIRKILLHESIAEDFVDQFVDLVKRIKYGDPMDPDTDMGTVISEKQATTIQSRVDNAIREGADNVIGNVREGALYSPTILDHVSPESELVVNETFGPVASIIRISDLDEAIDIINASKFRLAGAISTSSKDSAVRLHDSIQVGQFSWNGPPGYRTEEAPFGGFGDSGNGEKEGVVMMTRAMRRIRTVYEHI
jgi:aldehyde dehydrogenase (NAD+)